MIREEELQNRVAMVYFPKFGTLYPVNPWGYRVSDYIKHGDQGTK